nr:RNA-directed DNA polymerase, eukaryota, reverse transcriptase zinc-binding domain protein [Tanacetum cinerariifolium]
MVIMGSQRSKEDDVLKISTSIFVTNFPDRFGAKDLWYACKPYGHVVDTYIPDRRSKAVWVGRLKLHANVARYQRDPKHKQSYKASDYGKYTDKSESRKNGDGTKGTTNSFAQVVRGVQSQMDTQDNIPPMVLDYSCLNKEEISLRLLGKVKDFASLTNLKVVLANEGYTNIKLKYMGGFWVMIVLHEDETMNKFRFSLGVGSWFSQIMQAHHDFIIEERVMWVEMKTVFFESFKMVYRGKICWVRGIEVPGWVPDFEEESDDMSYDAPNDDDVPGGEVGIRNDLESEGTVEEVPETCFDDVPINQNMNDNSVRQSASHSKDLFGFTPNVEGDVSVVAPDIDVEGNRKSDVHVNGTTVERHDNVRNGVQSDTNESNCLAQKAKKDWVKEFSVSHKVNFVTLQETKMEKIDLWCIKRCWGNFAFDYAYSGAVGNSGGILCIWDPSMFLKMNETISDYFTIVRGTWVPSGMKMLIVSVYAPQEFKENKMLWDYLRSVVSNWDGQVVIMGDFNEVCDISERFGSVFNKKGAKVFNNFISNAGLVKVPFGGCSFTCCHKSAKKMSKLDRFLISDNLICACPNLSSISLDRFLSDHRPILMRECHGDYGPIPFEFFHYCIYKERTKSGKRNLKTELEIDRGDGNDSDVNRIHDIIRLIQDIEKVDTLEMAQKAKIKWAIEGDENSKFDQSSTCGIQLVREFSNQLSIEQNELLEGEEFQFYKGLKQGVPLSSFLFILVMESLHISFQRVVDVGLFKGIKLSPTLYMSHLFYADDAMFIGQWNQANIDNLIRVLDVFYRASGLRINISKSKLLGISVEASKLEHAAAKIGCVVLKTPFIYLGSRVGDHMSWIPSWNEIIEGMVSRLSKQKDINTRKPCWVSWKEVMASKDTGGLGVSSMFALNRALLFKWVWRFISQKNTIWARVIKALHGEDGKIGNHDSPTYPSIWLTIIQEIESLKAKGIDLSRFIAPILGNGITTSFWDVPWRSDVAFKVLAPRIYALETMKDIVVASKLSHNDLESSLRRQPRDGIEQAQLVLIKNILEGCILSNSTDRCAWNLVGSGEFSVSLVRKYIDDHLLLYGAMKTIWIKEVPIKINGHAWKVKNDGFPTRFNLSRRGMKIDSITCPLCDRTAESTRHLLFSWKVYCNVMRKITRCWELDYRDTNSYEEWLEWLISIRLPSKLKKVFEGICYIVWWHIWNWQNKKIFGQEKSPYASIFDEIISRSFYLIRFRSKVKFSWID